MVQVELTLAFVFVSRVSGIVVGLPGSFVRLVDGGWAVYSFR